MRCWCVCLGFLLEADAGVGVCLPRRNGEGGPAKLVDEVLVVADLVYVVLGNGVCFVIGRAIWLAIIRN